MPLKITFQQPGGPEVLEAVVAPSVDPGPEEVVIANRAIGVNFIDCYQRSGLYALDLPGTPGAEGMGIVEQVGDAVGTVAPGDRVIYFTKGGGAYAEEVVVPADQVMAVPETIDDTTAACLIVKGITAWYLLKRSYHVQAGDTVLLYAAAGGVGLIATQWARLLDGHVIGVVSTEEKADQARAAGAFEVLLADEDIPKRVREITKGEGVPAVYDSVGKDTFFASLDCLAKHGVMVSFGNASGPVEPFSLSELATRGSLYVTRPTLFDFISDRATFELAACELINHVQTGEISVAVNQRYPLKEAASAHRDLEGRRTTGCSILVP